MAFDRDNRLDFLRPDRLLIDGEQVDADVGGRVSQFGVPYHGLIKSGQIELPNMDTVPYPQPSDGSTMQIGVPPNTPIVRDPDQTTRDTMYGFQWKEHAIVAGENGYLHGQSIVIGDRPCGIYTDANGNRWLMKFDYNGNLSPSTIRFRVFLVQAFGRFVIGQSTPPPEFNLSLIGDFDAGLSNAGGGNIVVQQSASQSGYMVAQTKDGSTMYLNVAYAATQEYGLACVIRYDFSGNGDLTDGTGITCTPSLHLDTTDCRIEGDEDGDIITNEVRTSDCSDTITTDSTETEILPPFECDDAGDTGTNGIRERRCTQERDLTCGLETGLATNVGGPVFTGEGLHGPYVRITERDEVERITHLYLDDSETVITLGVKERIYFDDDIQQTYNGVTPPPFPGGLYDTCSQNNVRTENITCNFPAVTTVSVPTDQLTNDWEREQYYVQNSSLRCEYEFKVNGAIDETIQVILNRENILERELKAVAGKTINYDTGTQPPFPITIDCFAGTCTGPPGNLNAGDITVNELRRTRTYTVDIIDGGGTTNLLNFVEVNETVPNSEPGGYATRPNGDMMIQFDGTTVDGFIRNPINWFWITAFEIIPHSFSNAALGLKVRLSTDVESLPGSDVDLDTYWLCLSGGDKITGEVDQFATVNPEDGLILNDPDPVCYV